jgi:hypothetical protein
MIAPQLQDLFLAVLHHTDRTGGIVISHERVGDPGVALFLIGRNLVQIPMLNHILNKRIVIFELLRILIVVSHLVEILLSEQLLLESHQHLLLSFPLPQPQEVADCH